MATWGMVHFDVEPRCKQAGFRCAAPAAAVRRGVAQPGSAPEWGSGGRRFKSSLPDHQPSRQANVWPVGEGGSQTTQPSRQANAWPVGEGGSQTTQPSRQANVWPVGEGGSQTK